MAGGDESELDLDSARTQLYGVKPSEFVATRADLAKRARAAGDKPLAGEIQAMRKPTVAAWLVNRLARERRPDVERLLELGRDLREGMGGVDADGLRELTRRRHLLVADLVIEARRLGSDDGQRVGDDVARAVQTTLEATLSDAESADAVAEGCLSEPLEVSGFGFGLGLAADDLTPHGGAAARQPGLRAVQSADEGATVTDLGDRRARRDAEVAEAEQGLADAERLAEQAQQAYERAHAHTEDERRLADKASDRIDKLEARLEDARVELAERTQAAKAAKAAESDAEKTMQAAIRGLSAATERLRRLRR